MQISSLDTTKILANSVTFTLGGRFVTAEIKDFYYGKPLERFEYLKIVEII